MHIVVHVREHKMGNRHAEGYRPQHCRHPIPFVVATGDHGDRSRSRVGTDTDGGKNHEPDHP